LPRDTASAVEIRDSGAVRPTDVLARHGAAYVYNYWSAMPDARRAGQDDAAGGAALRHAAAAVRPGSVMRTRSRCSRRSTLVEPDDEMRRDVLDIVHRASAAGREACS
jgi:hypothetical protein